MQHPLDSSGSRRAAAFTLVELLVVIVIVAVLAAFVIMGVRKSMEKAAAVKSISNIRQGGAILLGDATENGGRLKLFRGGANAYALRHYIVVGNQVGYTPAGICEIMHWNPAKLKPGNGHWECLGINFSDYPALGVKWNNTESTSDGGNLGILSIATVTRPEAFPLLLDSSDANGKEIFRIYNSGTELPGLRNSGKASAFFLDGSARQLGPGDLKKAGFTKAYDNSVKPPKLINL